MGGQCCQDLAIECQPDVAHGDHPPSARGAMQEFDVAPGTQTELTQLSRAGVGEPRLVQHQATAEGEVRQRAGIGAHASDGTGAETSPECVLRYPGRSPLTFGFTALNARFDRNNRRETAMSETAVGTSMPRIGDPAPAFTAHTTQGDITFPADFSGSWVIFFSHPADFTPVCTTEFMTFASMEGEFAALNTKLVGLSVDGLFSHIAWLRTIQEKITFRGMANVEVKFPLVEDISMEVARLYGMIMPGEDSTKAVRAVFVVDPQGVIRTIIYYPLSTGRNFDELKRVIIALQTADALSVATPADWRPGDDVIVPPAGSCGPARDRMAGQEEGVECVDWFFCTRHVSEDEVMAAIRK
jgi:peroxiredoxin (alkyl hydroperoxide reductase subunit C)